MSASVGLVSVLDAACAIVASHREGHLPRLQRACIIELAAEHLGNPAVAVAVLDALPIVQLAHLVADDQLDMLVRLIAFERRAIIGDRSRAQVTGAQITCNTEANRAWARGDDRSEALWRGTNGMLGGVLVAEQLASLPADAGRDDVEIDPEDWHPAMECSVAASDGVPGEAGGDRERRRRYWWWWLRTAVPIAAGLHGSPLDAIDVRRAHRTRELLAQRDWSDEQWRELRHALAHRAPDDPTSWNDRQLKRQVRDEQRQLQR